MNGYQLIGSMRKVRAEFNLSTVDQALFHELVAVCNETKWKEVFFIKSAILCRDLGISDNTLRKSRCTLAGAGLISFETSRDKRIGCYYSFAHVLKNETLSSATIAAERDASSAPSSVPTADDATHTPIIESKTINKESTPPIETESRELLYPFTSEHFLSTWETLRHSPKWAKKPLTALQLSLNKLGQFDEAFAILQMERAIESNWTGVVFAETEQKYQEWIKHNNGTSNHTSEPSGNKSATERKESVNELTDLAGKVLRAIATQKFG